MYPGPPTRRSPAHDPESRRACPGPGSTPVPGSGTGWRRRGGRPRRLRRAGRGRSHPDLDGPERQPGELRLDRVRVRDHQERELRGIEVRRREAADVLRRDLAHAVGVPVPVVVRQPVHREIGHPRRGRAGRGEVRREAEHERGLRVLELPGGDGLVPQPPHLGEELLQRRSGHLRLHAPDDEARAAELPRVTARVDTVGVPLVLAQVPEEPRGHPAAEHLERDRARDVVVGRAAQPRHAEQEVRLRRVRLLEHDRAVRRGGGRGRERGRGLPRLPRAEALLEERSQVRLGHVADHDQLGVRGPPEAVVERGEVPRARRLHGLLGPERVVAVRVSAPEHRLEGLRRDRLRLIALLQERHEPLVLHALEVRLRERRVHRDVREELQEPRQVARERRAGERRRVHRRAGAERRAQEPGLVGDRGRAAGPRPLRHHRGGEAREPGLLLRVPRRAGVDHEVQRHDREPPVLDEPHREAIRQLELLLRGDAELGRRPVLRRLRAVRPGGRRGRRRGGPGLRGRRGRGGGRRRLLPRRGAGGGDGEQERDGGRALHEAAHRDSPFTAAAGAGAAAPGAAAGPAGRGTTDRTTRASLRRYVRTAADTSAPVASR